jgi:hypothetical protein
MGILPLPSRISILATGSWKVSQQYNGHDKIACFYAPARLAATDGPDNMILPSRRIPAHACRFKAFQPIKSIAPDGAVR